MRVKGPTAGGYVGKLCLPFRISHAVHLSGSVPTIPNAQGYPGSLKGHKWIIMQQLQTGLPKRCIIHAAKATCACPVLNWKTKMGTRALKESSDPELFLHLILALGGGSFVLLFCAIAGAPHNGKCSYWVLQEATLALTARPILQQNEWQGEWALLVNDTEPA